MLELIFDLWLFLYRKNFVPFYDIDKITVLHANDNIQLTGALVNHLDIYICMCVGRENSSGCTAGGFHSTSYNCDQGSSELNIIIGVENRDFENAVKAIYDIFVLTQI